MRVCVSCKVAEDQCVLVCRNEEEEILRLLQQIVFGDELCPEVELEQEELVADSVLTWLLRQQQGSSRMPGGPAGQHSHAFSLLLDLPTTSQLLRWHPDGSVRRQAYELAVEARCSAALQCLDCAADVRRCDACGLCCICVRCPRPWGDLMLFLASLPHRRIALCYDLRCFAELSHMGSVSGSPRATASLLLSLAHAVQPLAQARLELWQHQMLAGQVVQPWDIEWCSQQGLSKVREHPSPMQQHQPAERPDNQPTPQRQICTATAVNCLPSLPQVLEGLSTYLQRTMGITLSLQQHAPSQIESSEACAGADGDAHKPLQQLLLRLSHSTSNDSHAGCSYRTPVQVCDVKVEGRGCVGQLVLCPQGGFGTRFLTRGCSPFGGAAAAAMAVTATAAAPSCGDRVACPGAGERGNAGGQGACSSSQTGQDTLPAVLVGLHWPVQSQLLSDGCNMTLAEGESLNRTAAALYELCHEVGHGLHYLLTASAQRQASQQNRPQQGASGLQPALAWPSAAELPLEVLEVPSTLFELLAMQASVLAHLLPQGKYQRLDAVMYSTHAAAHV